MDVTIVNVALPTIGRDLRVSATDVDAISIAFLVSLAAFIPAKRLARRSVQGQAGADRGVHRGVWPLWHYQQP
jgi:hypothetical protein